MAVRRRGKGSSKQGHNGSVISAKSTCSIFGTNIPGEVEMEEVDVLA